MAKKLFFVGGNTNFKNFDERVVKELINQNNEDFPI